MLTNSFQKLCESKSYVNLKAHLTLTESSRYRAKTGGLISRFIFTFNQINSYKMGNIRRRRPALFRYINTDI